MTSGKKKKKVKADTSWEFLILVSGCFGLGSKSRLWEEGLSPNSLFGLGRECQEGVEMWCQGREAANRECTAEPVTTVESWTGIPGKMKKSVEMVWNSHLLPIWVGRLYTNSGLWREAPRDVNCLAPGALHIHALQSWAQRSRYLPLEVSWAQWKGARELCTCGDVRPRFGRPAGTPCDGRSRSLKRSFPYGAAWSPFQRSIFFSDETSLKGWVSVPWVVQATWT